MKRALANVLLSNPSLANAINHSIVNHSTMPDLSKKLDHSTVRRLVDCVTRNADGMMKFDGTRKIMDAAYPTAVGLRIRPKTGDGVSTKDAILHELRIRRRYSIAALTGLPTSRENASRVLSAIPTQEKILEAFPLAWAVDRSFTTVKGYVIYFDDERDAVASKLTNAEFFEDIL